MSYQNGPPPPTPSSEIIHCITTFIDTLDSVPPTLTRSLSDLKELDAVLSGSFANITGKLELLSAMMKAGKEVTPFERLKLLREVTEDARVFRLGGEDKIRVATTTCEGMATSTAHLSTLSTLLLKYLPAHLLPLLPPPSAPNGYPASVTPSSKIARRQIFDYPVHNHPGQGSTSRMQSAIGMVNEHWDVTRGRNAGKRDRKPMGTSNQSMGMGDLPYSLHSHAPQYKEKDKDQRHPNQYTKKKTVIPNEIPNQSMNYPLPSNSNLPPHSQQPLYNQGPLQNHNHNHNHSHQSLDQVNNPNGRTTGITFPNLNSNPIPEYNPQPSLPHSTVPAQPAQKRKSNESPPPSAGVPKRRKKSPSPLPPTLTHKVIEPELLPVENFEFIGEIGEEGLDLEEGEDGDGQIYCYCHRISFGEMIGCDGTECEREWFHLACVGLSSIPKGRWFCSECLTTEKNKKRR